MSTHLALPLAAKVMGVSDDTFRRMVYQGAVPGWAIIRSGRRRPRLYIARRWLEGAPLESGTLPLSQEKGS